MIEIIIAVAGSAAAGIWDLKTTEVPDEIPFLMVAAGLFIWFVELVNGNPAPLLMSAVTGTVVLAAGLLMYKHGKWGGADAWIFAAILYLVPFYDGKVLLFDYTLNLLWVSTAFTIAYALALGALNTHIIPHFLRDVRENAALVFGLPVAGALALSFMPSFPGAAIFVLWVMFMLFWRYARIIEDRVFRRRIPASQLKPGDVLEEMVWRGLTPGEVSRIKKSRKYVTIKEGMRFVPVFPITLVVTLLYGNVMFLIL